MNLSAHLQKEDNNNIIILHCGCGIKRKKEGFSLSLEGLWKPRWLAPPQGSNTCQISNWANFKEKGARLMTGVSCAEFTLNKEKDDICVFCS